jgi:Heterokaryon incompatibility protein (HET)
MSINSGIMFRLCFILLRRKWAFAESLQIPQYAKRPEAFQCAKPSPRTLKASVSILLTTLYPILDDSADGLRLVVLQPGTGNSTIKCKLESTTFSAKPRYRALSYEWGPVNREKLIIVNGIRVRIRETLWNALCHLRHPTEPQTLWIDAICINQADLEEKNKQIPLMTFIYRRASEVLVWLGPYQAHKKLDLTKPSTWISRNEELNAKLWPWIQAWLYQSIHAEYWKRTWIVQEIGAAPQIRVCSGRQSLLWSDFIAVVKAYRTRLDDDRVEKILRLDRMRHLKCQGADGYSLSSLIREFRDCFCENPRDKIYAFLGLAGDQFNRRLPVDYRKSLADVYEDFVNFSDQSDEDPATKQVEIMHMSALVRRILTRDYGKIVKVKMEFNDPDKAKSAAIPEKTENKESIPSLKSAFEKAIALAIVLAFIATLCAGVEIVKSSFAGPSQYTTIWKPSEPENVKDWQKHSQTPNRIGKEIKVRGVIAGGIEVLGPPVKDLASFEAAKSWSTAVTHHFTDTSRKKRAIALNERLLNIIDGESADARIRNITFYHPAAVEGKNISAAMPESPSSSQQHLCIASNTTLGIVPSTAEVGDLIVQFWNSNASAVFRRSGVGHYHVIGRAGIVKRGDTHDFDVPLEKESFDTNAAGGIDLSMDIAMLTRLSLDTVDLPPSQ